MTPKLILINGPAGIGKSTMAQKYINNHPLALNLSDDTFVGGMGQWISHEDAARELAYEHLFLVAAAHLQAGYDVVLPLLVLNSAVADRFAEIAAQNKVNFYEIQLFADREEAIQRLIKRGSWGEPGSPPIVLADRPIIEDLYDRMQQVAQERPNTIVINSKIDDIEGVYSRIAEITSQPPRHN